jgi:DNA uptake protein ComE-like DNA-binding protein
VHALAGVLATVVLLAGSAVHGDAQVPAAADSASGVAAPLNVNEATRAELGRLPLPPGIVDAIVDHRTYVAPFQGLFDLLRVRGMTPALLQRIRDRISVTPVFEAARREQEDEDRRSGELHDLVQRLLSEEGASEGLVDEYVDQLRDPRNLNRLGYSDLVAFQNVSPVDAVAILRERAVAGRFENARAMRSAPGLSYWGFRNLRDFVRYDDPDAGHERLRVDAQFRLYDTPYLLDDAAILNENIVGDTDGLGPGQTANFRNYDLNTYAGRLALDTTDPAMTQKIRMRYGSHWRAGALAHRNLGEIDWNETSKAFVSLEDVRGPGTPLGPLHLRNAVLGHYAVAFGLGLVMENTDFYMPRRTGLGYSVRSIGVRGDVSRTEEYALRGAALEGSIGRLRGSFFVSRDHKDAVLNPDGSFNTYIRMTPRLSDGLLAGIRSDIAAGVWAGRGDTSAFLPMRDVLDERVVGGHLAGELAPGTMIGVTGVEIRSRNRVFDGPRADRWNPDPTTLVIDPNRLEDRDAEIGAGYNSLALGDYRRIWGADAQTVWRNVAVAGEYAKLETARESGAFTRILGAGPEAWLGQAYVQYENFNVLALYRDYDLGYDNPYNRAFSEDARFEQTLIDGNAFRLRNPYWAELARFVPQPKAERGWYVSTRYQFHRQFTLSGLEYDTWTRKADGASLQRLTARLEYRPIFPLRLRLRHSMTSRDATNRDDIRAYDAWDSRFELLANLSSMDQLRFLYSTSNVRFAARGRLSGPASGGDTQGDTTAVRGSPGRALQGQLTHHLGPHLVVTFSSEIYDGFLYNYEDNEFVVVDGEGVRHWVMVRSRLSDRLSWRLKWTADHTRPRTYVDIRSFGNLVAPTPDAVNARGDRTSYRLQLDLTL